LYIKESKKSIKLLNSAQVVRRRLPRLVIEEKNRSMYIVVRHKSEIDETTRPLTRGGKRVKLVGKSREQNNPVHGTEVKVIIVVD
jgi:hypothetical protein